MKHHCTNDVSCKSSCLIKKIYTNFKKNLGLLGFRVILEKRNLQSG